MNPAVADTDPPAKGGGFEIPYQLRRTLVHSNFKSRTIIGDDFRDIAMQKTIEGYACWFHLVLECRPIKRAQ